MTKHTVMIGNSNNLATIPDKSVNLIVTSPPYPMIKMWDEIFGEQDASIKKALAVQNGMDAFLKMHHLLNDVWSECDRVLADNGFICINIGDATRSIGDDFELYSNHTQIINFFANKGYSILPDIHWRKQSNSPNKFMGSGMYPAGAYVTYEHEYILIFRKGGKRQFAGKQKALRQKSAYFWEERNIWFSDLWEIKGTSQAAMTANSTRERNASYPLEIPFRLINMYSTESDTVLDPFLGFGTTCIACMIANRNSIGVEIDPAIAEIALQNMTVPPSELNHFIVSRLSKHVDFINTLSEDKKLKCYYNTYHDFLVKTRQEVAIQIEKISSVTKQNHTITCQYSI